jgi:uncharacterized protein YidB (DUF937 family)
MGLLDELEGMAGNQGQNTNATVAGGLLQALDEHPGGLAGVISSFQNNGMASHVQQWSTGQPSTATPDQIQQGLNGTGLIDRVAAKAGVSPEVAKIGMAVALPSSFRTSPRTASKPHPRTLAPAATAAWPPKSSASSSNPQPESGDFPWQIFKHSRTSTPQ